MNNRHPDASSDSRGISTQTAVYYQTEPMYQPYMPYPQYEQQQLQYQMQYFPYPPAYPAAPATHFSIDVECVATGYSHNARAVAQVAVVDEYEQTLLNRIVKPTEAVVSCLTPLTGLTMERLESEGASHSQVVNEVKQVLPKNAILVGVNIQQDVQWLGLREGIDFQGMRDLQGLYQVQHPKFKSPTRFGLAHLARVLLDIQSGEPHDAANDAWKSIKLWNLYSQLEADPSRFQKAKDDLLNTPTEPSFASLNPTCDGVCMGNKKTCQCGGPMFF